MMANLHDSSSRAYKKARRQHLKTTKYQNSNADLGWTPFRAAEKQYKARFPPPDLSDVLDLATLDTARTEEIQRGVWSGRPNAVECREITPKGPSRECRKAYIIPQIPGAAVSCVICIHILISDPQDWYCYRLLCLLSSRNDLFSGPSLTKRDIRMRQTSISITFFLKMGYGIHVSGRKMTPAKMFLSSLVHKPLSSPLMFLRDPER
jgi:hypothetical protein